MEQFYKYEARLAITPLFKFIEKYSKRGQGKLADIGCGNKPFIKYFKHVDGYFGVDVANARADVIADAKSLPIKSATLEVVMCNHVLEHDPEPNKIVEEIYRILIKGGVLIMSAPQMARLHGEPDDYYRFTKWGLEFLLEKNGMKIDLIESHGGFFRAIGSHINFFIIEYFGSSKTRRYILRRTIVVMNNIIFDFLDKLIYWDKDTLNYGIIATKLG
ncbi:MAG: class I SAM-dependent methyltransferase [Deltaproteobacteria bacterium]|nr:class I SAM-dependent methyltransferase [Deltaproteobacteria bacterium]